MILGTWQKKKPHTCSHIFRTNTHLRHNSTGHLQEKSRNKGGVELTSHIFFMANSFAVHFKGHSIPLIQEHEERPSGNSPFHEPPPF